MSREKQLERELTACRERATQAEDGPLGYQSLDHDGNLIVVNQTWLSLLGYEREEVLGRSFGEFLHPEQVSAFKERFPRFKAEGKIRTAFRMRHKDGAFRVVAFDGRIGHHPDGTFKQTHCVLTDITERQTAEDALRESEARLAESNQILTGVFDHTPSMAAYLDPHFSFIWVNRAYAKSCGHEVSFFPGKNHFDLYPHAENQKIFQRVVDTGEPIFVSEKAFEFPDQPKRGCHVLGLECHPGERPVGADERPRIHPRRGHQAQETARPTRSIRPALEHGHARRWRGTRDQQPLVLRSLQSGEPRGRPSAAHFGS
ncbi:MAG: PAS domain S-box protein [Deltaproteobacteria bacterium]|nr:PAS domain S-box protein [Deltaproteobacteria bacterium]